MDKAELARVMGSARTRDDGKPERRQGLGLALARQLVEAHGGTLKLQSRKGAGPTALVTLPRFAIFPIFPPWRAFARIPPPNCVQGKGLEERRDGTEGGTRCRFG